jgi:hypothetical protein
VDSIKVKDDSDLSNIVYQTYWKKIGTDEDGNTGEFFGATPFPVSSVNPENFTPFDELTKEIVLSWIMPKVVGDYAKHVNKQIQIQIDNKKTPGSEKELPGNSVIESVVEPEIEPVVEQESISEPITPVVAPRQMIWPDAEEEQAKFEAELAAKNNIET